MSTKKLAGILVILIITLLLLLGIRNIVSGNQSLDTLINDPHVGGNIIPYNPDNGSGNGGTNPPDNTGNGSGDITAREATKAYQEYIAAYNKLTDLMSQGLGDTPEARQAYAEYKEAKQKYEQIAQSLK